MNDTLQQAIALARAGQIPAAATLLQGLIERDPNNSEAWLWFGGLSTDSGERFKALKRVLELDPGNARAQQGLESLRRQQPELFGTTTKFDDGPTVASQSVLASPTAASYTSATLPMAAVTQTSVQGDTNRNRASIYDAPTLANQVITPQPSAYAAPTIPMGAVTATPNPMVYEASTAPYQVTTSATASTLPPLFSEPTRPERMVSVAPAVPPLDNTAQLPVVEQAKPRRSGLAVSARVLLTLVWLLVTAIAVTIAALSYRYALDRGRDSNAFVPAELQNVLTNFGYQVTPGILELVAIGAGILGGVGAIILLGMILRWRLALILSLIASLLLAILGVIIAVAEFSFGGILTGIGDLVGLGSQVASIVLAVILAWPLLMSFVAWPEFFRRRTTA